MNREDMALEQNYSLGAAANHAISFTDLAIQRFAAQPENTDVAFTHAYPGGVKAPLSDNSPFFVRIPVKCAIAVGLGFSPGDCAELMLHRMLGTDQG
jgi:hypothetical protein